MPFEDVMLATVFCAVAVMFKFWQCHVMSHYCCMFW